MHTGGPVKTAARLTENNKKYLKTRADPIRLSLLPFHHLQVFQNAILLPLEIPMHTGGPVKTAARLTENNKKYLKTRADPIRLSLGE